MIIFLQQSLLKREGLFWQKNNDGKRFITVNYFSLGIRYTHSNTKKEMTQFPFLGYLYKLCMQPQYQ